MRLIQLDEMEKEATLFKQIFEEFAEEAERMEDVYGRRLSVQEYNRAIETAIHSAGKLDKQRKIVIEGIFDTYIGALFNSGHDAAKLFADKIISKTSA
ncbi:hypothetical protein [Paenibacillus agaridevorans]|uniref:hypothetical protein n=1 Tax=Paenibacillus agaridevorans TaxID=171404 RepID=UPI001BE419F5|nr:hypothetical protein [Paenibacillus agaridevorans]